MDQALYSIVLVFVLFGLLASGVWVAISLLIVGFLGMVLFTDGPVGSILATTVWGNSNSWSLAALPMFIWVGEILFRSRLSKDLFDGLAPWLARLPGSLLHVNIVGCGVFAAVSGSSAVTCATVGKMSVPELKQRGYKNSMIIGTLAGSGTLGLLIPPSLILIVYGVATEESIARLFLAGVGPGFLVLALFMTYVALWSTFSKQNHLAAPELRLSLGDMFARSKLLIPVLLLIFGIIGSIYTGIASPTDAAAVGVLLSLLLVWFSGELDWKLFTDSLISATRTSCMIALILAGASFLTVSMGFTGLPRDLATWIGDFQFSKFTLLAALTVFFVLLGCFLDGISIVVLTTAVIVPLIEASGIDRIWFGVYLVLVVEMSQITPPVGFNLFVLQNITGENILKIAWYSLPFFLLLILALVLIITFPDIALYLPNQMTK